MPGLYFVCACTHCQRSTEIEIKKLGRLTRCQFCGQNFLAIDASNQSAALDDPLNYWIRYTDHGFSTNENESAIEKDITRTPR